MDGDTFIYEGRSGPWICTIYLQTSADGNFSAVADIVFRGQHRCKLVMCQPRIASEADIDILRRRCVDWIDKAELEAEPALST